MSADQDNKESYFYPSFLLFQAQLTICDQHVANVLDKYIEMDAYSAISNKQQLTVRHVITLLTRYVDSEPRNIYF
jgi:hypothetical protein